MASPWSAPGITSRTFGPQSQTPTYHGADTIAEALMPPDISGYRTPEMDWADMMRGVGRTWEERVPLQSMQRQLMSRYQLGQPGGQGFGAFLQDQTRRAADLASLRTQAQLAANLGGMTAAEFANYRAQQGLDTPQDIYSLSMRGYFDPSVQGNVANQMEVANLLAQQRATGGQWQGRMADLIRQGVQDLAAQRASEGYGRGTFLDWYLGQTQ